MNVTPILLLEINEVPWRLIDRYAALPEYPHLREFLAGSHQLTTMAVDTGELSPWVTWPTLHRGMNNELHGIRNLGQDPRTFHGTPVWEEIRARGGTIGIFGSMQSWPPSDPGEGGFYVPDTFARDERCIPESVSGVQAFNLDQVRRNSRVVDSAFPGLGEMFAFARACVRAGVRPSTLARLAAQVVSERLVPSRAARRPVFQTVIFWDLFRRHFNAAHPPAFSTFFTNHVAGVMHRYWKDVFPEDFPADRAQGESREPVMRFALKVLDEILADVLAWSRTNRDLVVVFAASMGQAAVHGTRHEGVELLVDDLERLMAFAGVERRAYQPLLAMAPQVAVRIEDGALRAHARAGLENVHFKGAAPFIRVQETGDSLSISVHTPLASDMRSGTLVCGARSLEAADAGLLVRQVEPGTGYHVPEGTFAVYAPQASERIRDRPRVAADRIKEWLLSVSEGGASRVASIADRNRAAA